MAGLALVAALLGACSAPAPGAAASVDGEVISQGAVASVVEELSPYLQQPLTPIGAVSELIAAPVYVDVAADAGLGVSDEQAEEVLGGLAAQLGVEGVRYSDDTLLVARSLLARTAIQSDADADDLMGEVSERLSALDVTVSPRYGTWDAGTITPITPPWIAQPATEAA